jgi:predicted CoA-substrate-specific enzyme activase
MVLGLDIGSCYTKGILFDGEIKEKVVLKTSFKPKLAIEEVKRLLVESTLCRVGRPDPWREDPTREADRGLPQAVAVTGYGRELVPNPDLVITEITATARGCMFINPTCRTLIDIGGQDSKVIKVLNGKVERFVMNDRCAAGTGNFIEKIAQSLELSLEEFGKQALKSNHPETIDSLCVVMAETEILSLAGEGKKIEDIVAGVCDALVRRVIGIGSQVGIEEPIIFCGGGALNPGLVKAIKRILGNIIVPPAPQFIGALGAAVSIGQ